MPRWQVARCRKRATRSQEEPSKTVNTDRRLGALRKANPLRRLCGGRLHRWLRLWVLGRDRESTPWPGWPASRLILARFVLESCSSPSTDRVMTDTSMWRLRWSRAPWRQWWRDRSSRATRDGLATAASPCPTHSTRSKDWAAPYAKPGVAKLPASRGAWARPQRRKSWRHC